MDDKHHSFASLQARLGKIVDTSDCGELLPLTEAALSLNDATNQLVALVKALETERVIAPALVESAGECTTTVSRTATEHGDATVTFTSVHSLQQWDRRARPIPMPADKQAMIAVAETGGRLIVNPTTDAPGIRLPRPAVIALAHRDTWLPPWQDRELSEILNRHLNRAVAYVSLLPSPTETQVILVGVTEAGLRDRGKVGEAIRDMSREARLETACERVEFRPVPAHIA
ncbi:MAG: SseB family protein [Actinomycetaceae bacterium]|nr:SseB family protein [Actinomycetaceae bacterium]